MLGRRLVGVLLTSALSCSIALLTTGPAQADAPTIMVVGDSISQGMEGDYTWRYRLADHFARTGTAVNFVGPWTGTNVLPPDVGSAGPNHSGAYRPGISFDSDHMAQWGWQMHQAREVIAARVNTYKPDYLLVELGFNDLGWGVNSPDGLLNDLEWFVYWAREVKPDIRIAVANVVHRTPLENVPNLPGIISEYNTKLASRAGALSNEFSPLAVVDIDTPFDENRDAYDGLHPGIRGEHVIAKAFADTLSSRLGLGQGYGAIPTSLPAPLTPAAPASISATPVGEKVEVSWSRVFGATAYEYYQRDATAGTAFTKGFFDIGANSWTADLLPAGHKMEFYVRTRRGTDWVSSKSATVSATVKGLPEVQNVRLTSNPSRPYTVTVSWDPVAGADDYSVYSAPGCDILPPDPSQFKLQQWGLGSRTTWTQEYVFDRCVHYKVAASRYGGQSPLPWAAPKISPYINNYSHLLARNRYFDTPAESGDRRANTTTTSGNDRGIVVVRGFIRNTNPFTDMIGDHRGFDANPYASAKIGVAYDTSNGQIGVYVHKSCVIGYSVPAPWEEGCKDARPIAFVPDASVYGDSSTGTANYVSTAWVNGALVITVSAMNSQGSGLGRINAKITLTPSGNTFSAKLVGDKFPAWEVLRYPRTSPATVGQYGAQYVIGTRDQTLLGDLESGESSTCTSRSPEEQAPGPNPAYPMSC
ncbi:GDSL-type esterase/lipase family protein [Micromonospora zamorensis]|uniref:GDSL-type esterase/lipase family protein n=1 Tax=Micromonospora zamorensis TaxID=709883 RepID=UPI003D8F790F